MYPIYDYGMNYFGGYPCYFGIPTPPPVVHSEPITDAYIAHPVENTHSDATALLLTCAAVGVMGGLLFASRGRKAGQLMQKALADAQAETRGLIQGVEAKANEALTRANAAHESITGLGQKVDEGFSGLGKKIEALGQPATKTAEEIAAEGKKLYEEACEAFMNDDVEKAVKLWEQAGETHQNPDALFKAGMCHIDGVIKDGRRIFNKNPEKAVELLQKAADLGHSEALNELGVCHITGEGGILKSDKKAFECFKEAVNADKEGTNIPARTNLGECFQNGTGVDKIDLDKAIEIHEATTKLPAFKKNPDPKVFFNLGVCYDKKAAAGGIDANKYYQKAAKWYNAAIIKGKNHKAMIRLGEIYEKGLGGVVDDLKALDLYKNALGSCITSYRKGDKSVLDDIKTLYSKLEPVPSQNLPKLTAGIKTGVQTVLDNAKQILVESGLLTDTKRTMALRDSDILPVTSSPFALAADLRTPPLVGTTPKSVSLGRVAIDGEPLTVYAPTVAVGNGTSDKSFVAGSFKPVAPTPAPVPHPVPMPAPAGTSDPLAKAVAEDKRGKLGAETVPVVPIAKEIDLSTMPVTVLGSDGKVLQEAIKNGERTTGYKFYKYDNLGRKIQDIEYDESGKLVGIVEETHDNLGKSTVRFIDPEGNVM